MSGPVSTIGQIAPILRAASLPFRWRQVDFSRLTKSAEAVIDSGMTTLPDILALGFSDAELVRHMPPRIAEFARVIGLQQAIKVSLRYGGTSYWFPTEKTDKSDLAEIIGQEDAQKLCRYLREHYDFRIDIPNSVNGALYRRLQGIKMLREGRNYRDVVQTLGVSRSTARKWCADFVRAAEL